MNGRMPYPTSPAFAVSYTFLHFVDAIQLNEAVTESDLFIYVIKSARTFERSVYGAAYRQSATSVGEPSRDPELDGEGEQFNARSIGVFPEVVERMDGMLRAYMFEPLEEAADR